MDALLSARASALAFIEGDDCIVVHSDDISNARKIDFGMLKYVFAEVTDVVYMPQITRQEAIRAFSVEVESEEAFHLSLMLLDRTLDVELRQAAAIELDSSLRNVLIDTSIKNVLSSLPLPAEADVQFALTLTSNAGRVAGFLAGIWEMQPIITEVRKSWDAIDDAQFETRSSRSEFLSTAVKRGAFRVFVDTLARRPELFNSALVEVLQMLRDQPNSRSVITLWTAHFRQKPQEIRDSLRAVALKEAEEARWEHLEGSSSNPERGHKSFQRVLAQQRAIWEQLLTGNVRLARRFTDDLVSNQIALDKPELAAKSLCKLAQDANSVGQYSLQLEWAKRATELCPNDAVAHGHLADAYIYLNRFDEALASLDEVSRLGDARYAATNKARILRAQGRLDDALMAFDYLRQAFGREDGNGFAWNGYAEVLRDMWRFEAALEAYREAVDAYPQDTVAQSGMAAVLAELGKLDDALHVYDQLLQQGVHDSYAIIGKANVCKQMGDLKEALSTYQAATRQYPQASPAVAGLASIQRQMRKYEDALQTLRGGIERFPFDPALACEVAEVFRDQGRTRDALEIYQQAAREFPWNSRLLNGVAQVNKDLGRFADALQVYDQAISRFPYDQASRIGRADCFKKLRRFDDCLRAYDDIIERWPEHVGARHSKAAVLVALERYEQAKKLLPQGAPQTLQEWIAHHVRGMILLKTNKIREAIEHFEAAAREIPFARERKFFNNALAVALLKKEQFDDVTKMPLPPEPMSNVLLFHAFAGRGERARALSVLRNVEASGSAEIIELGIEIARRFKIHPGQPTHDDGWIFQEECQTVLLEAA